ncbi:MAG TPA: DUF732 domain-containing protein [Mycobacterium sp.]|nr:DUF732 domain-containing protein [Mycobacterium sp.]
MFLVLEVGGQLPGFFAYPAALGDIAVGLTACIAVIALIWKGILPHTLGLTNGRDEVGLGYGICDALDNHSASDVDAGINRHWPNLSQLQVNALIGFAVAAFCEQNSGKLN